MKKFMFLFAVLVIGFTSCMNEEGNVFDDYNMNDVEVQLDEVTVEIISLSKSFIKKQGKADERLSPYATFMAIDRGVYYESVIGGANEEQSTYDAVNASIDAYQDWSGGGITPPNPTGDVSLSANPLDFVGKLHVEILDYVIKEPTGIFKNGNETDFTATLAYCNSVFNQNGLSSYIGNASSLEQAVSSGTNTVQNANHLLSSLVTGQSNAEIALKNYFLATESSQNVEDFVDYSVQAEMLVIGSQQYSPAQKNYLLGNMATARHDIHYWGS